MHDRPLFIAREPAPPREEPPEEQPAQPPRSLQELRKWLHESQVVRRAQRAPALAVVSPAVPASLTSMTACDHEGCPAVASISFIFRAADGSALSPRWNRCPKHATEQLPEIAPQGSIIEVSGPRDAPAERE
jgi:hypothetical protein